MTITENTVEKQRHLVFGKKPELNLVKPCKIGQGILAHSIDEKQYYSKKYTESSQQLKLFIPASGSGSRMFQFLFDFIENPSDDNRGKVERFLNHIEDFAFYRKINQKIKKQLENNEIELLDFVNYIVNKDGLNYGGLPKGLIPFHQYGYFMLNPFQEQVLQATRLNKDFARIHFTINQKFETQIKDSINQINEISGKQALTEFSFQNANSDSIAFSEDQSVVLNEEGQPLTRPSGHGALLNNLNQIDADIVFIKNIDNLQHQSSYGQTSDEMLYISGLLTVFNDALKKFYHQEVVNKTELEAFLKQYELCVDNAAILSLSETELKAWLNKPRRVCGMVKNEGQSGGGPFWVYNNGSISKQIVEKTQINLSSEQYNVMVKSSHFNPVMMACNMNGLDGKKLDLEDFCDNEAYFIVNKRHQGKPVKFLEQPGLWNGGMAHWHTVFVEIPSVTFNPVKNILDLLDDSHKIN